MLLTGARVPPAVHGRNNHSRLSRYPLRPIIMYIPEYDVARTIEGGWERSLFWTKKKKKTIRIYDRGAHAVGRQVDGTYNVTPWLHAIYYINFLRGKY